ncbi:fatty acyl-AMP ligase [Streptomyces sp. PTM05]|uniref:Fatty acyl-AMP ligase n=1 Tax=Streptantibioticus parmotrematis TaxID=2873249 RepID=A0ABS7QSC6_9ACTN|nr:fatty acyl-AMP ligase [Streptantibioticus parmotrematis]MBY8886102.1 fatty acyl-AMP ligase [Streptantibioticus parmotrematis]
MVRTFVDCLHEQAARYGRTRWYAYVEDHRGVLTETGRVTYRELDGRALHLGSALTANDATDRAVLLLYPAGPQFLTAFFGCLYARAIAVPAPLPATDPRALERAERIIHDADVRLILTDAAHRDRIRRWLRATGLHHTVRCLATDAAHLPPPRPRTALPAVTPATTAYLQYTSGSTSEPRGVVVSHGNLTHNSTQINELIRAPHEGTGAGWLPHYHDMGLVGQLLQPLYTGGNMVIASPLAFVVRPRLWLEMINRYRARATMAPNFAYEWLLRSLRDDDLKDLDLSCLEWALNGAEPVRPNTMRRLTELLEPRGLDPRVWAPAYGMAEATLLVTGTPRDAGSHLQRFDIARLEHHHAVPASGAHTTELASSGRPVGNDVRIVDTTTRAPLPDGRVGEIWVASASIAQGYWRSPEATRQTFHGRLADGSGPYLRTGDLGFSLKGELYVTGRLKEVIIVHGRNLYPHDIEEAARHAHPAAGTAAAFGLQADGEHIVVIQEIRDQDLGALTESELAQRVKKAVARSTGVHPSVLLVPRNTIPRTTSGKIRRSHLKSLVLAGEAAIRHADTHPRVAAALTPQNPQGHITQPQPNGRTP